MNRSDRNPLREGSGKGDKPRSCHNPKFRKNWDNIKWNKNKESKFTQNGLLKISIKSPWIDFA